jgi:hypothetical protein
LHVGSVHVLLQVPIPVREHVQPFVHESIEQLPAPLQVMVQSLPEHLRVALPFPLVESVQPP